MRITLAVDFNEDGLKQLKTFYKAMEQAVSPVTVTASTTPEVVLYKTEAKPVEDKTAKADTPPWIEPSKPVISKTEVRAAALKISKAGKADILRKIFAEFDADNLKGIPEDKYDELMKRLVEVNV